MTVGHAGEGPGEEFEGALARLLGRVHLANVENVEQAAREGYDKAVADGVHEVDAFGERVRGLLRGRSAGVPETDRTIPGTCDDGICGRKKGKKCQKRLEGKGARCTQLASLE